MSSDNRRDLHSFPTRRSSDLSEPPEVDGFETTMHDQLGDCAARCGGVHHAVARKTRDDVEIGEAPAAVRSEEHTSELQSRRDLVCRLLLEKKKEYSVSKFL